MQLFDENTFPGLPLSTISLPFVSLDQATILSHRDSCHIPLSGFPFLFISLNDPPSTEYIPSPSTTI